jgi:hypothetical protein
MNNTFTAVQLLMQADQLAATIEDHKAVEPPAPTDELVWRRAELHSLAMDLFTADLAKSKEQGDERTV